MSGNPTFQALLAAADRGDVEKIKQHLLPLLDRNCPTMTNDRKIMLQREMANETSTTLVDFFAEIKDDFSGQTMFHFAASSGKIDVLKFLLCEIVIDSRLQLRSDNEDKCESESPMSVIMAVKKTILDQQDNDQWTALHSAVTGESLECVKVLVEHGASLDVVGFGGTPIEVAQANEENTEIYEFLSSVRCKPARKEDIVKKKKEGTSDEQEHQQLLHLIEQLRQENQMLKILWNQEREAHHCTQIALAQAETELKALKEQHK